MAFIADKFKPVTSVSSRYFRSSSKVDACHITTAPGVRPSSVIYTNSKWLSFIHPEGQRYFQQQRAQFSVVTEENVLNKETDDLVSNWLTTIEQRILECDITLPPACELFVELCFDEPSHASTCAYYFVDRHRRCLFWLEPVSSEMLEMGMVVSTSHLNIALERLYWVHVEFFPMHVVHIYAQMAPRILDDLVSVISHGMADRITSRTSTFPYTEAKCGQLLQVLHVQRGKPVDGHALCLVARLWGVINNQRFMTYYGQEVAQLDRLHRIMPEDIVDRPGIRAMANMALWGFPNHYNSKLHDLFVNDQVYVDQWQAFTTECISEWRGMFSWAFSVLIASILISMLPYASVTSAVAPIIAASSSILCGSILLLRHRGFEDTTASFAAHFLRTAKSSKWGFLSLSVVYSMPKSLYLWSLGLMVAQLMFWVSRIVGILWALGGVCLLTLMGCGILYSTSLVDNLSDSMDGIRLSGSDEAV